MSDKKGNAVFWEGYQTGVDKGVEQGQLIGFNLAISCLQDLHEIESVEYLINVRKLLTKIGFFKDEKIEDKNE